MLYKMYLCIHCREAYMFLYDFFSPYETTKPILRIMNNEYIIKICFYGELYLTEYSKIFTN